jgi:putative two-component system response regulator
MTLPNDESVATIMVVDDTPANLRLLETMLRRQGHRVVAFPSSPLALAAARRNPPDLVLLDIMMPEMDGFEVCRRLKEDARLAGIPVLFISALDDQKNKVRAFSEGGVDFVTKPFHEEEVLARVDTHLSMCRMRRQLIAHNSFLEELVEEKLREISDSRLATLLAVSKLAEYRDNETGRHIERTRTFCRLLAERLACERGCAAVVDARYVENIHNAASLHDIGKVGIPDNILLKPGPLTTDEFAVMKTHTLIGAKTLESVRTQYPGNAFINMGIELTRSHHERWDGAGYPDGLATTEIPLSARIMSVADVYDALRSRRPYKEPFSHERAVSILAEGRETQFDPNVVDAFLEIADTFAAIHNRLRDDDDRGEALA